MFVQSKRFNYVCLLLLPLLVSIESSSVRQADDSKSNNVRSLHQEGIPHDDFPFTHPQQPQQHPPEDVPGIPTTAGSNDNNNKQKLEATKEDFESFSHVFGINEDGTQDFIFRLKSAGLSTTQKDQVETLIQEYGTNDTKLLYEYSHAIFGFAMSSVPSVLRGKIDDLLRNSIDHVERDSELFLDSGVEATIDPEIHHHPPSWGLDRLDRFDVETYNHTNVYQFDGRYHYRYSGIGVRVFVLDSGVRDTHFDLAPRVTCGFDAFPTYDNENTSCIDKVGHGTFMAGVIGGIIYGVAKKVELTSVKVFNDVGFGTVSSAIAGLDYVMAQKKAHPRGSAVANLSFGMVMGDHDILEEAVEAVTAAGVTVVVSSGNHGSLDCMHTPAHFESVITVAASTYKDESAHYNDLGRCVDLFAPGDRVSGIWSRHDEDTVTISGSSIASAHVAGAAALMMEAFPRFTPEHVRLALKDTSEQGSITRIPEESNTHNHLVNTAILTVDPEYDGIGPVAPLAQ